MAEFQALVELPKIGRSMIYSIKIASDTGRKYGKVAQKEAPMTEKNTQKCVLPYDMGNAGDLIKHGALVHFIRWWCEQHPTAPEFRFADSFGGIPRERVENDEINGRLHMLRSNAGQTKVAECLWDGEFYRNSTHIVTEAALKFRANQNLEPEVWASDKCPEFRAKLADSGLGMLDDKYPGYKCDDGYSVLERAGDFDLVLLDPFGDLVRKELHQFRNVGDAVHKNPNVTVAVFVLYKDGDSSRYQTERSKLGEGKMAFSLCCPRLPDNHGIRGETPYNMEILLVSQMLAGDNSREKFREFLHQYKNAVETALAPDGQLDSTEKPDILLWPYR